MNCKKILFSFVLLTIQTLVSYGQMSLTNASPSNTIDFSSSMQSTIGNGAFTGAGFQASPTAGQLNSNAWSCPTATPLPWSSGALAFGGTQTTATTDYTSGSTAVAVTSGGMYAFTGAPHSAANPCLMFQPATGDFTPGTLVLRIQNNGTTNITDLAISYNLFVRNDQGRSNSFNFSYSPDNTTYTAVSGLDYTSTAVADALGWVQVGTSPSRSTTITGLAITPGSYYYIRWSGADVGGSGSRDEFGLDDITVTATYPPVTITSFQDGPWGVGTTWIGGVAPTAANSVIINHNVYLDSSVTRNAPTTTTVNVGGSLATAISGGAGFNYTNTGNTTINGTFKVEGDSFATGNNFTYGPGATLNFNNTVANKSVPNTAVYWPAASGPTNVNVVGDILLGASMPRTVTGTFSTGTKASAGITSVATSVITVTGTVRIDAGGQFFNATSAPIYGASSNLIYNTGSATTNRFNEWAASGVGTIGTTQGYPNNVQISNNTTVRYNSAATVRAMNGNLTIDSGSTFDLTVGAPTLDVPIAGSVVNNGTFKFSNAATAGSVAVAGNFTNSGTVTMSATPTTGGHLKLAGNFSNSSTLFNGATRSIIFTKTGTQTVASSVALTFPYVQTTGSPTTIQLLNNLTISAPNAGAALTFGNASDIFDLNGQTLTIGTPTFANTISGSGSFKGSTTSNLTLLGTGSIGNISFAAGSQNLGNFSIDRTASAVGCVMTSALTVNSNLTLTNGHIDLGATTMTLAAGVNPTGSANSHVIADVSALGILNKVVSATGTNYVFPIGSGGTEYAPATVNFSAGTFSSATYGMAVENPATGHPNWSSASSYIKRYWSLTSSGITTPTYDFSATYPATDVVGTVGPFFKSNQWDGSDWTNGGIAITAGTISKTGCTLNAGTNHISAAIRDQEIDIRGGGNVIVSGATTTSGLNGTAFGTQTIASNTTKTYTIFNRGGLTLNLTGAPLVQIGGANPGDFVVTAVPGTSAIAGESSTTFQITFTPSYGGYRTATVSIANNDSNENPYTFVVDGTGDCSPVPANTITPTSGPVGTEITITATSNTLTSASATLNGLSATVTQIDATHITAIVPTGAVSGTLITTNNLGCQASSTFTVIDNAATSCQGGSTASELFMSEVTDSNSGSLTYIEIYNGTGSAKNLGTYSIKVANNGGAYSLAMTLNSVSLANGSTYVIALGNDSACGTPGGNGSYAAQTSGASSINFAVNGHDHYGLFNGVTLIDSWGTFGSNNWAPASIGTEGVSFRRKNTATLPSTTYSNSDWNIIDFFGSGASACANNDYTNIGQYNFKSGNPPLVTALTYTPTCKGTVLTVTGTEGFSGGNALVYNWYAVANGSNVWNAISDGGIYSGATTNTLTISDIATVLNYQFYCQVNENTSTCYIASNAVKITASQGTTWQASNTWSNGVPTIDTAVIIDNDYDTSNGVSPSFDACSVTINSGKTVTIRANDFVNIKNDLTVTGNLSVESNGSLVMINDNGVVTNTGTTQVKRTATGIRGFDYVYWSSPVLNQSVDTFYSSPAPGYKYFWNPLAANINSPVSSGTWQSMSGTMAPGSGYIVRGSSAYGLPAGNIPGIFTGKVNSGVVPVTIQRGNNTTASTVGPGNGVTITNYDDNWNLVGNPYPSSIKALDFLNANTNIQGFVYLWTHGNAPAVGPNPFYNSFVYNYTDTDYITYNGTGTTSGPTGFNGYIAAGQGFFVLMNDGATGSGTVNFRNNMRSKTYSNSQFYRTASQTGSDDKHRIWLDIVNSNNVSARTLIGYVPEATVGLDRLYDAFKNTANDFNIYSLAENQTLTIQGRPSPFDSNDLVPIGVRVMQDGAYKIAIGAVDGLFANTPQNIYLEDKQLGIIHDLRENPYSFNATAGVINDRFVLRYNGNALGNPDFEPVNAISLSANHGQMTIKSSVETIQEVTVFDLLGRQLFNVKSIGSKDFTTSNITISQQALIVKIKLENGTIITRKIVM